MHESALEPDREPGSGLSVAAREYELREGFPMPMIILKYINSFAPCCESYFDFLLIEVPTSRYKN